MMQRRRRDLCMAIVAAALLQVAASAHSDDIPVVPTVVASAASPVEPGRIVMPKGRECRPGYPVRALERGAHGATHLRFYLDATGKPTAVGIVESAGPTPEHRLLDLAAAKGLIGCPFVAGRDANGQPVPSEVDVTYTWKIE